MQGKLILSLGLLGLVNGQQLPPQPAMAPERRDICLVNCGEGWCCVSGQKCIAGPSKDFSTPYGCEDEILGFHTTWEAYRGDFKEWTSTTWVHGDHEPTPSPTSTPAPPPPVISESTTTTTRHPVVTTPSVWYPPPPPPPPAPSSGSSGEEHSSTTVIASYPAHEPEPEPESPMYPVYPSSTESAPVYIETSYPSYPEGSSSSCSCSCSCSTPAIISYPAASPSISYSNSTTSLQASPPPPPPTPSSGTIKSTFCCLPTYLPTWLRPQYYLLCLTTPDHHCCTLFLVFTIFLFLLFCNIILS